MPTHKEAYEAFKTIQKYCKDSICRKCIFGYKKGILCRLEDVGLSDGENVHTLVYELGEEIIVDNLKRLESGDKCKN